MRRNSQADALRKAARAIGRLIAESGTLNEGRRKFNWDDFTGTDDFKSEVKSIAEDEMDTLTSAIEEAISEITGVVVSNLEDNHATMDDSDEASVRGEVYDVVKDAASEYIKKNGL